MGNQGRTGTNLALGWSNRIHAIPPIALDTYPVTKRFFNLLSTFFLFFLSSGTDRDANAKKNISICRIEEVDRRLSLATEDYLRLRHAAKDAHAASAEDQRQCNEARRQVDYDEGSSGHCSVLLIYLNAICSIPS